MVDYRWSISSTITDRASVCGSPSGLSRDRKLGCVNPLYCQVRRVAHLNPRAQRAHPKCFLAHRLDDDDNLLVPRSPGIDVIARSVITRVYICYEYVHPREKYFFVSFSRFFLRSVCLIEREIFQLRGKLEIVFLFFFFFFLMLMKVIC